MSGGPSRSSGTRRLAADPRSLARAHGIFNVAGGLWPLLHLRSFEAVFGSKVDRWLEYTVAGLLLVNGGAQLAAAVDGDLRRARQLGCGTAATLLAIDLIYVPRGAIPATYLGDGVMEASWLVLWGRSRPR